MSAEQRVHELQGKILHLLKALGKPGSCRSCGVSGFWCLTKKEKWILIEHDGTVHFARCQQAKDWRNKPCQSAERAVPGSD